MIRQLVWSYVLLVAVAIAAFTVPVAFTLNQQLYDDAVNTARREADTAALLLASGDTRSLNALVDAYERQTPGQIDVLEAQPESKVWDDEGLELTVPATTTDGTVVGAIRLSYPDDQITQRLWQIWGFRAALAVTVLIAAAFLGVWLAKRVTRPLRELNVMASRLRDGDLAARAEETGPPETRTLARTLNTATETIGTLVGSQRAFIGDASHQLRTPLTALRLSLDNVADGVDDPTVREDVEMATAEVVRMSRLVNGLLALARAEADVPHPEPVQVLDVVAERFTAWRAAADERSISLVSEGFDIRVLATPGHLEQVLDNVLSNSLEVSPDGATILVRTTRPGLVEVIDAGPGLPQADRARAFDRFWRGQGLTGKGGSGLGLAIVKQLVTDDGGAVSLEAASSGGLCVRIRLAPASPTSGGSR
ncbi:HAMP domain-containing sensor histidine kinase [Lentzea flaviverrucosa]|uniref:histidine kinase n=1 Tax=Lentzea flaviverrucosa TaxID=200379 RepID=A0A1H9W3U1_9PSEU|nr:HAMP domain-containing sensor histidine kinase [Lentzea flaviverrucosa]RDI22402.1 signal transduction histidine kinase [Lentzea flaviverrucosa]SES28538.1 Signal transduction histidine kinase [Lentzea flaviverrucosa]